MPDVGTLNITIKSDAEQAAQGLKELAGALSDVQKAAPNGLNLAGISGPLNKFAKAVKDNSKPLANIGTFLNAITNYKNAFKKIEDIKFNSEPITKLKEAIGDGIKIGQAGTQINNLRNALVGEWNTNNAYQAGIALSAIAEGAKNVSDAKLATTAKNVSAVAKALDEYATAAEHVKSAVGESAWNGQDMVGGGAGMEANAIGANVSEGMAEGIRDKQDAVASASSELANSAVINTLKTELDVHSPSEVTHEIGVNAGLGLAQGLESTKGTVQSIAEEIAETLYTTLNVKAIMDTPLEYMRDIYKTPTKSMDEYKNAVGAVLPKVQELSSEEMMMAAHGRMAKEAIDGIISSLDQKISYKGLSDFVDAMTGVTGGKQGAGLINESTTMFTPLDTAVESFKHVEEATSGMVRIFDEASGSYKEVHVAATDVAEATDKVTESIQAANESIREGVSLVNAPASGKFGVFANASEELSYLTEKLNEAKFSMQQFSDIASAAEKQLKYGGPMNKDELVFNLQHATEGFYQAAEAEQYYQNALDQAADHAVNMVELFRRSTEQAAEAEPLSAAMDKVNEASKGAAEEGLREIDEEIRKIVDSTSPAVSKIELLQEKIRYMWGHVAKMYQMPETDEAGNDTGRDEAINNYLLKIGQTNEQLQRLIEKAHEAQEALQFDSLKSGADNLQRGYGSEMVANMVDNYNEIDLLTMKMEGLKQALADDINQNKVDTQQIADRVIAIQNLKNKIDELREAQEQAANTTRTFSDVWNGLKGGLTRMFPTISGLLKRFKSMMIMRSLRYVIRSLSKGFSEGVQNVYQYSKAVGTSFAPAMDQAATAMQQLKNSIGAAVSPVIQALIPILQNVVNWVITGINYLNQFFALLNGQATWTRALPEAAEAFEKNTKAAKGSSKAMKDLLADWDELNIIQSNSGSGGGSGTGKTAEEYKNMFEEVSEFNSTIKNIVDGIEDTFGDIWGLVKRIGAIILGWKLSNAFTGIVGTLGALAGSVIDIGLVFELSTMFTNNFLKTGNAGWLVGDVLTTLVGSVIARKLLSKVLGGVLAKVAIPLTFAVSAAATIKALVQKTDVTALSEKGILSAMNAALEGGVASGALLYSTGAYTLATSAGVGVGAALFTFGATVGIKATADVVNTKEITSDTIAADFLAAGSIGAGLALSEAVLGGTIATIATVGLGGALLAFGAFIAVQAIIANDKIHVQWGDYDATEKEIKAFVEEKVFATSPDAILQLIDPVVEVATTSNKELETTVGKVKLSVEKLTIGYDVDDTLKDLEKQVFGDSESGTTGLIGQFKATAKAHQSVIETGMTLVPTTNDDGSVKEILERDSDALQMLTGHMDDLGKELWGHLQTAYSDSVDEGTKKMELRTIAELTQMMTNVSAAITRGEQYEEAMLGLEANLRNLTKGSWSNMFNYIEQYKEQVKDAFAQAYEAATIEVAGRTSGLEESWKNELKLAEKAKTESEREAHLAKARAYEDEYKYWSNYLAERRAGRDDAIEAAAQGAMNQDTVDRINEVLSGIVAKDLIDKSDVRGLDIAEDMWTALFNQNGEQSEYAERELTGWLDEMIDAAFGEDADAIKEAISLGFLGYGDVIDQAVLDELADAIGINGTSDSTIQGAWKALIDKVFGNEEPKTPGLDNTKLDSSVSSAKEAIAGLVSYVQNEMSRLSETGFDVWASFHGKVDTIPVEQRATGGFVKSGDLVLANENGNFEMMGKMGNQPVVANNQQIVSGISQGVSQANTDVVSELRTVANLMQKMLQKEFVARAVPGSDWGGHNARSNMAYEKVTG